METLMLCRSAFCQACHDAGRPKENDLFALYKGTSKEMISQKVGSRNVWGDKIMPGYTPHLISFISLVDNDVHYMHNCMMNNCGIKLFSNIDPSGEQFIDIDFIDTKHSIMSLECWNALVTKWRGYTGFEV